MPTLLKRWRSFLTGAGLMSALTLGQSQAEQFLSPDILILGDSQISFGSGPAFLEFFTDIKKHCHLSLIHI